MLIPSVDLMGGKVVQLIQGERKALEFDSLSVWIERFRKFSTVQVIDLDAAMGTGNNSNLVQQLCAELSCQVGGGLRNTKAIRAVLNSGAVKAIIGSSLFKSGSINTGFAAELAEEFGPEKLIFAVDSRGGIIAIKGWKQSTGLSPARAIQDLDPYCSAFLYTHIDTEGLMQGFPSTVLNYLREATTRKLIVAGGITTQAEVDRLHSLGIDAVVGMAIYTGAMPV